MKAAFTIVCSILFYVSLAQYQAPKVIPPSPNASAFQRYGDVPVSTYNGVSNISVPLYDVKSGDIQFPISLSYHASGIKVADEASKVGLGWVINSSGIISRTILGGDDFTTNPDMLPYHNSTVPELIGSDYSGTLYTVQWGCAVQIFGQSVDYLNYDSEPDQYYFSLPGRESGKFILKRDKTVVLEKDELIDIQVLNNGAKWLIRTSNGFSYEFDKYEDHYSDQSHRTAWYLTRIISPTKNTVTFWYSIGATNITTVGAFTQERDDGAIIGGCPSAPFYNPTPSGRQYNNVQLDSITFKEGAIRFLYSVRDDISGDRKLDGMEVSKKINGSPISYQSAKKIIFSYEYFQGTNDQIAGNPSAYESKRLKLKRVQHRSKNNKIESNYTFEYNNESGSSLPSKLSFARDHWGYYNSKSSNQTLIPSFTPYESTDPYLRMLGLMGNERNPDPDGAGLFSLKRIYYPTGGYTDIELESNDFDLKQSLNNDNSSYYTPEVVRHSINLSYSGSIHVTYPASFSEAVQAGKVIDLRDAGATEVKLNAFFRFNSSRNNCSFSTEITTFQLVGENGTVYGDANIFQALAGPNASCSGNPNIPSYQGINYTNTYSVPPGRYYWRLYIAPNVTLFADVNPTFTYYKLKNVTMIGGGLRTKRIQTYESPSATPQVTRYEYNYWNDTNMDGQLEKYSYGRRMVNPRYSYFTVSGVNCENLKRCSESSLPLARNGSAVSYDRVTVYYGENGENGKTLYVYHNDADLVLDYTQQSLPRKPPANPTISNPLNGMLKAQYDFKYSGANQFDSVRTVLNTYANSYGSTNSIIWARERRPVEYEGGTQCLHYQSFIYPAIKRSRVKLIASTERIHDMTDVSKAMVIKTTNTYSTTHFQLIQQEQTINGKKITTKTKYALDYTDPQCTPAMIAMKSMKYSPVVQARREQLVGTTTSVLDQNVTTYDYFNGTSMILPSSQASFMLAAPELASNVPDHIPLNGVDTTKYRVFYRLVYNADGNIESIKIPNDGATSYLWNNLSAPIAEIKNSSVALCAFTSFENGVNEGNWTFTVKPTSGVSKTGVKYFSLTGSSVITKQLLGGKYFIEYYAKSAITITPASGLTVTDVATSQADANGWVYYKKQLSASTSVQLRLTTGGATIGIDELRLYPTTAQITSYAYEPLIGMITATDPNGRTVYYEYDEFNRLKLIRDDNRNILKTFSYRLKDQEQ